LESVAPIPDSARVTPMILVSDDLIAGATPAGTSDFSHRQDGASAELAPNDGAVALSLLQPLSSFAYTAPDGTRQVRSSPPSPPASP